ncbi:MAG: aminotransferase class I/II-fold pyridoxal phosphate-dependent enzyme [Alphaproteobacteria bacterium]
MPERDDRPDRKNALSIEDMGPATRAIHLGYDPASHQGALTPPVYMTSTFAFETAEEGADTVAGRRAGYVYGRAKNPTQTLLEQRIASLEGGEAGLATASGMGAISATMWTLLKAGETMVVDHAIYGSAFAFFMEGLTRFGVTVRLVDMTDLAAVEAAVGATRPRLLYFESPSNPGVRILDIASLAAIAHGSGALAVVDNTFASPVLQQPIGLGADLVIHSATKYLGGHGDLLAGVVVGRADQVNAIRGFGLRWTTGATIAPHTAFLLLRGLKTLHLRVRQHCASALTVARFLEGSAKVARVAYPMLDSFAGAGLARRQMAAGGGIVSLEMAGGKAAALRLIDALRMIHCAVSLGDAETLVQHPATMTHASYTDEQRATAGITDALVRFSVGLEEVDDILADIAQALDAV